MNINDFKANCSGIKLRFAVLVCPGVTICSKKFHAALNIMVTIDSIEFGL